VTSPALQWTIAILGGYTLGSVPFGFLIARARGIDIRQHGSRNIGATNVGRVLGRRWGALCFALDMLKGAAAVALAGWLTGTLGEAHAPAPEAWLWLGVAIAAVAGHMFTIFLRFKGGKGVATGFGALVAMWPHLTLPALVALVVWLVTLRTTRFVSVSSCVAAVSLPLSVAAQCVARGGAWAESSPFLIVTAALGALVIWKHRGNLRRVAKGTEPKVGAMGGDEGR